MGRIDAASVALACVRQTLDELDDADQQAIEDVAGEHISGAEADDVRAELAWWVPRMRSVLPPAGTEGGGQDG